MTQPDTSTITLRATIERLLQPDGNGLLPCPFCEGEARRGEEPYKAHASDTRMKKQIYCSECFAAVDVLDSVNALDEVTAIWNTRAYTDALRALLDQNEKLAGALEKYMAAYPCQRWCIADAEAKMALSAHRAAMGDKA